MVAQSSKKRSLLVFGLVMTALLAVLGSIWLLLRHEPAFYRSAAPPTDEKLRKQLASPFFGVLAELARCFNDVEDAKGEIEIKAECINSFLKESFQPGVEETRALEKQGISEPRVCFDRDRVLLGFRYRNSFMTSVITVEMRIWLVPTEINTFAIEILNRRAGALPFPTQALLEEISTTARKRKFEVNWYRHEGHPVALVRIQSNGPRPTAKFDRIDVEPGMMKLNVVANEPAGAQASNPPPPQPPRGSSAGDETKDTLPGFDPKMLRQQASPTPE